MMTLRRVGSRRYDPCQPRRGRIMFFCETGDLSLGLNRSNAVASEEHLLVRELTHRVNNELTSAIGVASLTASRSKSEEGRVALAGAFKVFSTCHFFIVPS